jgi:hypothetical protein
VLALGANAGKGGGERPLKVLVTKSSAHPPAEVAPTFVLGRLVIGVGQRIESLTRADPDTWATLDEVGGRLRRRRPFWEMAGEGE